MAKPKDYAVLDGRFHGDLLGAGFLHDVGDFGIQRIKLYRYH